MSLSLCVCLHLSVLVPPRWRKVDRVSSSHLSAYHTMHADILSENKKKKPPNTIILTDFNIPPPSSTPQSVPQRMFQNKSVAKEGRRRGTERTYLKTRPASCRCRICIVRYGTCSIQKRGRRLPSESPWLGNDFPCGRVGF